MGNSISGNSGGWNPYYIYLNSNKLGYSTLDYDASTDNVYTFVFRARGVQGSADIGGVEVIRTLGTGITFVKTDNSQLTYDIFPSLSVDVGYFAKNIGTKDNTLEITPSLSPQGEKYDAAGFKVFPSVTVN